MQKPYAVTFTVPGTLWLTTTGTESTSRRASTRAKLRAYGRRVWNDMIYANHLTSTERFVMQVAVLGRDESPVLAAETLKPLIDAGTDMGMWPDDDPWHRAMTCYLAAPPGGRGTTRIIIRVVPIGPDDDPLRLVLGCVPGARGRLISMSVTGDEKRGDWLTSNMRLDPAERRARQTRVMRQAAGEWGDIAIGPDAAVVCGVRYPDPRRRYKGDPDNTAETATAMWGAGAVAGLVPASPSMFAFTLLDGQSAPGQHDMELLAFATPHGMDWMGALG